MVLAVASLGAAVAFVDATIVNIAFPDIAESFPGTSITTLSWILSAYNIVFAAFLVTAGRLSDLVGRRRLFVLGLWIFTVASALCSVAPSAGWLIAFRVVQATGAALLVPSSLALVLNAFPEHERSHGVALLSAVAVFAAGLGPSLGGMLIAIDDWRLVFLVNIPIGLAAIWLARRQLVESRAPGRRRMPDVLGSVALAGAVGTLVLGVVKGSDWGWGSPTTLVTFAIAILLGAWFVYRCSTQRSPVLDLSWLRIRTFSASNAMTIVAGAGFYGYTLTNVLFLTGIWRYSVLQAGLALTPGPFIAAAVAGPSSSLASRIGHRWVLLAGGLIWGAGVLWLINRVGDTPAFLAEWLPAMAILGVGAGMLLPNISAAAVASAPGDGYATATAVNSVARQFGAAFGIAMVVAIIGQPNPLQAADALRDAWTFGAVCLFVAGVGCLLVGRVLPERAPSLRESAAAMLALQRSATDASEPPPRARRAIHLSEGEPVVNRPESPAEFLARVPLFEHLPEPLRATVAAGMRTVVLGPGEWLFHEGDHADAMYVVRVGRLQVVDEREDELIREIGRGDAVGELAIITSSTRAASVRATRASELLAIDRDRFEELLLSSPELSLALTRELGEQLRQSRRPVRVARPRPATVALVAVDRRVPLMDLAHQLEIELARLLSVATLDAHAVVDVPRGDGTKAAFAPLLDRTEAQSDLVLLVAGTLSAGEDAWRDFCIAQADRILVVGTGEEDAADLPDRGDLRGCDLVGYGVRPGSGALSGLAQRLDPGECHTVRAATAEDDVSRIARRLAGRSIGLVLSGGGARAFAHIGVLEELLAAGVRIDRVAGVSMGAFIGGLLAIGLDAEEIDARCFNEWVQRHPLGDYTVPRHGLIRGDRVRAMLQRTFGEIAIEELPLGFMCGCADLRTSRMVVARHGVLWEAVGLSINLPILAPPHVRDGGLLVDGSLVDNLPLKALADLGEGPLIAVDIRAGFERPAGSTAPDAPLSLTERPPPLGETVMRVLQAGSADTSESARRHADLLIRPRTGGVGLFEFHQIDAARESGRRAAQEALAKAPAFLFNA